jgi:hypothetical protein
LAFYAVLRGEREPGAAIGAIAGNAGEGADQKRDRGCEHFLGELPMGRFGCSAW